MPENPLAERIGTQVSLTGHFDVPVRLEKAKVENGVLEPLRELGLLDEDNE